MTDAEYEAAMKMSDALCRELFMIGAMRMWVCQSEVSHEEWQRRAEYKMAEWLAEKETRGRC